MNEKQRAQWERTRAKGMWRFVLLWGLVVGGAMIFAVAIFDYFLTPTELFFRGLTIKVPIFLLAAFVGGVILWWVGEYQYKKSS
jgi:hypothetical protein